MSEQPERPPLAERLITGLREGIEWAKGERELRTTVVEKREGEPLVRRMYWGTGREQGREIEIPAGPPPGAEGSGLVTYEPGADALSIRLPGGDYHDSDEIEPGLVLDYDQTGQVIGIEILDIKKRLAAAEEQSAVEAPPATATTAV